MAILGNPCALQLLLSPKKRGQHKYYKVDSDCSYKHQSAKSRLTFSAENKCTNAVLECSICHKSIWKYNLPLHMAGEHAGVDISTADIVSKEVKKLLCKTESKQ